MESRSEQQERSAELLEIIFEEKLKIAEELKRIVEHIERLEEEKAKISSDIKDVYAEAKSNGFDVKTLREIIKTREKGPKIPLEQIAIKLPSLSSL